MPAPSPGKRYEDGEVGDPAEAASLEEVRAIRDDIDLRIQAVEPTRAPSTARGRSDEACLAAS